MGKVLVSTVFFALVGLTFVSAQTVVLINGVPTKVQLSGTEIVKVIGVEDNYMAGFQTKVDDFKTVDQDVTALATTSAPAPTNTTTQTTNTTSTTTTTTSTASNTPLVAGNYFKFERNSALLSQLSINEIKDYAIKVTTGQASSVTLQSFYSSNDPRSEKLTKNRLDACKKYFELNGVSPSAISVESIPNDRQSDKVSITLQ